MTLLPCRYSLNWANSRVSELREKYARVLDLTEKILQIDDRILGKMLSIGSKSFYHVRELVHFCYKLQSNGRFVYAEDTIAYNFFCISESRGWEKIAQIVDKRYNCATLKEQGKRGETETVLPDRFPSFSPPEIELQGELFAVQRSIQEGSVGSSESSFERPSDCK
jgi:hypothetical protein